MTNILTEFNHLRLKVAYKRLTLCIYVGVDFNTECDF